MRILEKQLSAQMECCPQCGKVLGTGRVDKRFCSEACKNRWHNCQRAPSHAKRVQRVLRILDSNREVLVKLLKLDIHKLDRGTLLFLGFNPNYFTSLYRCGRRQWIYSCLDVQYELTPSRIKNIAFLWEGADKKEKEGGVMPLPVSSEGL